MAGGITPAWKYEGDAVFFDKNNGGALSAGYDGSPEKPLNSEADVLTQLAAKNLSKVFITSSLNNTGATYFTVPSDMTGISFWANASPQLGSVVFAGQNAIRCDFHNLGLIGYNGATGYSMAYNCQVAMADNNGWAYFDCDMQNNTAPSTTADPYFVRCQFDAAIIYTTGPNSFIDCSGWITLHGVTSSIAISGVGGLKITLSSDCTGGTISLYGDATYDASGSGGTTVNDNTAGGLTSTSAGLTQTFSKNITSAANAGDVTVATVTTQGCNISSVSVRSNAATTTDLTTVAVAGGTSKVVTFIDTTLGARANIAATDQQVAWTGMVSLEATGTIIITLAGTGATAVDLTVDIEYQAQTSGGYLA